MDRVRADVCIIGAGAAGLTLARELAHGQLSVCLLESGGHGPAPDPDPAYEIVSIELPIAADSRARALGGTTTLWVGKWKYFDPIDLEPRPWVPHSGWPITLADLAPYAARADRAAGLPDAPIVQSPFATEHLLPIVFRVQPEAQRNWGISQAAALSAPNVTLHLDTHVVRLERRGRRVDRVIARRGDTELAIEAKHTVIAAGGIENARLLLLSDLGNEHDQVGRYYMDHPKARQGVIETYAALPRAHWDTFGEGDPIYLGFRLSDELQREHRVLNSHVLFQPLFEKDLPRRLLHRVRSPAACRMFAVRNYLEQAPDPENRVFLHSDRDVFGLPKAAVRWRLSARDLHTMQVFHRVIARELQRTGIGELDSSLARGGDLVDLIDASHHIGTTRMGVDPKTSVVDPSCRVHSLDNLYIAGSSVFPTSGYANPTATIAALAIRLADHLRAWA